MSSSGSPLPPSASIALKRSTMRRTARSASTPHTMPAAAPARRISLRRRGQGQQRTRLQPGPGEASIPHRAEAQGEMSEITKRLKADAERYGVTPRKAGYVLLACGAAAPIVLRRIAHIRAYMDQQLSPWPDDPGWLMKLVGSHLLSESDRRRASG